MVLHVDTAPCGSPPLHPCAPWRSALKVLVTAAPAHGMAAEVAEAIAEGLRHRGTAADVAAPEAVTDLSDYGAVVLGCGGAHADWQPAAIAFVERFRNDLQSRPVWSFSTRPNGAECLSEDLAMAVVLGSIKVRDHRVFSGPSRRYRGRGRRFSFRSAPARHGDFRLWSAAEAWSGSIADALTRAHSG